MTASQPREVMDASEVNPNVRHVPELKILVAPVPVRGLNPISGLRLSGPSNT